MISKKRWTVSLVLGAACLLLSAALIVGNAFAWRYADLISNALGQKIFEVVTMDGDMTDTAYFKSDYTKLSALQAAEADFARRAQAEGSVLLRNGADGNILPLAKTGGVTLLGSSCGTADNAFQYGGGGAGSIDTKNTPSFKTAFENAGYKVNPVMWEFYTTGAGKSKRSATAVGEAGVAPMTDKEKDSFAAYRDAAVVVIGRPGQESSDLSIDLGNGKHMLELSDEEIALIDFAASAEAGFGKVVILLNTMNPLELGPVAEKNVAVVWIGAGGQKGVEAIPDLLNGTRYPSGRLVDTYAYDNLGAPAVVNFGEFTLANGDAENYANKIVSYQEGIYVGYRYYETRYEDVVLGKESRDNFEYEDEVLYPFGYGLAYTSFAYGDLSASVKEKSIDFSLPVTNNGKLAGKEVVQIYMQSSYTEYDRANGVEKAAVALVGFVKTGELAPGAHETVRVSVPKEALRSYDAYGKKTYIVDDGNYYFAAGRNAHDALDNVLAKKSANVDTSYGSVDKTLMSAAGKASLVYVYNVEEFSDELYNIGADEEKITNSLADVDYKYYDAAYKYLTRADWTGTWPAPLGGAERTLTAPQEMLNDTKNKFAEDKNAVKPVMGTVSAEYGKLTLASVMDLPTDSEYWDVLCDQLSAADMHTLVRMGGYATALTPSVGKPATVDKDGPAGISSTLVGGAGCFGFPVEVLVASSWNVAIAEEMGDFVGEDGLYSGVSGWYAPGLNNHRTPFAGRNFEYYSEDGLLGGKFGAAVTRGCQAKGVYPYIKHYAMNDQETARAGLLTFTNEQAAREIYLRPFEIAVREGKALGLMVTNGRAGAYWCGAHKGMMTDILRDEWGFGGIAITDQASYAWLYYQYMDAGLVAGTDMWLNTDNTLWKLENYAESPTLLTAMRRASKHILITVAHSNAMNGIAPSSKVVPVMAAWQIWLIIVDIAVWLGSAVAIFFIVRGLLKRSKD